MERKIRDYPHYDLLADFPSTLKSSVVNNTLTASVSNQNIDRVNNILLSHGSLECEMGG